MNNISISVLVSAVLFAMAGCQAFSLVNSTNIPVKFSYMKATRMLLVGEGGPMRTYPVGPHDVRNVGRLQDGPGLYVLRLERNFTVADVITADINDQTELEAIQPIPQIPTAMKLRVIEHIPLASSSIFMAPHSRKENCE